MSPAARKKNYCRGRIFYSGCVDKCITGDSLSAGRGRTADDGSGMDANPDRGFGLCRRRVLASTAEWV